MSEWIKSDGALIELVFDQPVNAVSDADASHFTVIVPEYNYVPGGTISDVAKTVLHVSNKIEDAHSVILEMSPLQRFESAAGQIIVAYDGTGSLAGAGGSVAPFEAQFMPVGLIAKPGQNDAEHLSIAGITANGVIIQVCYTNAQDGGEHISIAGITAVGTLTHINDI